MIFPKKELKISSGSNLKIPKKLEFPFYFRIIIAYV